MRKVPFVTSKYFTVTVIAVVLIAMGLLAFAQMRPETDYDSEALFYWTIQTCIKVA